MKEIIHRNAKFAIKAFEMYLDRHFGSYNLFHTNLLKNQAKNDHETKYLYKCGIYENICIEKSC